MNRWVKYHFGLMTGRRAVIFNDWVGVSNNFRTKSTLSLALAHINHNAS